MRYKYRCSSLELKDTEWGKKVRGVCICVNGQTNRLIMIVKGRCSRDGNDDGHSNNSEERVECHDAKRLHLLCSTYACVEHTLGADCETGTTLNCSPEPLFQQCRGRLVVSSLGTKGGSGSRTDSGGACCSRHTRFADRWERKQKRSVGGRQANTPNRWCRPGRNLARVAMRDRHHGYQRKSGWIRKSRQGMILLLGVTLSVCCASSE